VSGATGTSPPWVRRPERRADERPLFLRELIAGAKAGSRVLDAGCGPGSWSYGERPDLRVVAFDVKFPPGPPPPAPHVAVLRADLARLPLRDASFDLVVCHYVLEHVIPLAACCDSLARLTRPGGTLYLSVPRSASFDDRLYRFAGLFAKYGMLKLGKRLEHQQRFDLARLVGLFYARGMVLRAFASIPAGFSWMNDPRTKPFQLAFTRVVAGLKRTLGLDLARDANIVLAFERTGETGLRRVTHVCRACGEHVIIDPPRPAPTEWTCPWCGATNPLGVPPDA
jgi:SAM-dependent methyltransferase